MKKHVAIVNKLAAEAILSGQKTIESRFSKHKIAPFSMVSCGDIIYLKISGEDIVGQLTVKKVFYYEGLTATDFDKIWADFGSSLSVGDSSWDRFYIQSKRDSVYGTLIFIGQSERFITSPLKFRKADQRAWVVLK